MFRQRQHIKVNKYASEREKKEVEVDDNECEMAACECAAKHPTAGSFRMEIYRCALKPLNLLKAAVGIELEESRTDDLVAECAFLDEI